MPGSPFTKSNIRARVESNVLKVQSALLEWIESPTTDVDYHTTIIQRLVDTLDAYASTYLEGVEEESRVDEYNKLLRDIGRKLIENAEKRGVLSDLYSDQRLRKIAENSGDLNLRIRSLTPEQRESAISAEIERLRSQMAPQALDWRLQNAEILFRIETRFEARYRHWASEAIDRVQRMTSKPGGEGPTRTEPDLSPPTDETIGTERRRAVDGYIEEVLRLTGKRIIRTDIWKLARYQTRTEFERWERNDPRATHTANARFSRILSEKPHLKPK